MDERWESLVAAARAMMAERQAATIAQFGLDYSMQYKWDTERAEMVFSSKGIAIVRADFQLAGSIAGRERTWLWGWANESIPRPATHRLDTVRQYGQEQGFSKLTEPVWVPDGDDGHDVMMVSASIMNAPAFFHAHVGNTALFFVLEEFQCLGDWAMGRT
jgi:hypothetical protein